MADDIERYLRDARLAGDVATPRESNLGHAKAFAAGDEAYLFGLPPRRHWSYEEVVALMAERVGIDPDVERDTGSDTIDPALTRRALDTMRDRVTAAAERRERVLVASGHPDGVIEIHIELLGALRRAGCPVLRPAAGARYSVDPTYADAHRSLRIEYVDGVATAADSERPRHSHSPVGMRLMLAALDEAGEAPPDLVIADHGFAGAAAAVGLDVVSFADSNDPGLFVGEAEGRVLVTVPIDDNVAPHLYAPVSAYLLTGLT
jgi:hypothetical protein